MREESTQTPIWHAKWVSPSRKLSMLPYPPNTSKVGSGKKKYQRHHGVGFSRTHEIRLREAGFPNGKRHLILSHCWDPTSPLRPATAKYPQARLEHQLDFRIGALFKLGMRPLCRIQDHILQAWTARTARCHWIKQLFQKRKDRKWLCPEGESIDPSRLMLPSKSQYLQNHRRLQTRKWQSRPDRPESLPRRSRKQSIPQTQSRESLAKWERPHCSRDASPRAASSRSATSFCPRQNAAKGQWLQTIPYVYLIRR